MQNVSQTCKVKVAKSHFIILWRFGVTEEKTLIRPPPPPPGIDMVKAITYCFFWSSCCIISHAFGSSVITVSLEIICGLQCVPKITLV